MLFDACQKWPNTRAISTVSYDSALLMHSHLRTPLASFCAFSLFVVASMPVGALWAAPPSNDDFSGREEVFASSGVFTAGTNVDATTQSGEQVPSGFTAANHQASIWYEWTPDFGGWYEINTIGSSVDTMLSVWSGPALGSLTLAHVNDDASGGSTSRIWLNATGATTYYICIAGKTGKPRGGTQLAVFFIPDPLVTSVSAVSFSPASANVTSAAATLTIDVTMQANATPDLGYFRVYDPSGNSFAESSLSVADRISGNNSSGVYRVTLGIPAHAQPGSYRWALRVQNTSGSKVGSYGWEEFSRSNLVPSVTVQNTGAVDTYLHWQKLHQLSGTGSAQTEDFDGDGITNLLEFAFGSDPKAGSRAIVATSGGSIVTLGLPDLQVVGSGDSRRIKATFVRRVADASGMTTAANFGDVPLTLSPAASPTVIATNGTYEVVTVEDQIAMPASTKRFGAVKVTYPFP